MKKYHKHDCSVCTYLGSKTLGSDYSNQDVDLYICLREHDWETSLVVRFGSEGSEYYSIDQSCYEQVYLSGKYPREDKYKTIYNKAIQKGLINKLS